jgi:hypothetical protein
MILSESVQLFWITRSTNANGQHFGRPCRKESYPVMAGLDPAIHVFGAIPLDVDAHTSAGTAK